VSFVAELNRRNVIRIALPFRAGAWFLLQIVDNLMPAIDMSEADFRVPGA